VFGERPKPISTPEERRADATGDGRVQLALAKRSPIPTVAPKTVSLPKTATDAEIKMIAGSVLLALGLILLVFTRRRKFAR
jgi:Ca-activated chloride channel family protein